MVGVVCALLATLGRHAQTVLERQRAIAAIVAAGGACALEPGAWGLGPADGSLRPDRRALFRDLALGLQPTQLVVRSSQSAKTSALLGRLPALNGVRRLTLDVRGLRDDDCRALARLNRLEELEIVQPGPRLTGRGLEPGLRPGLRTLALLDADFADDDLALLELPTSLEFLDLWGCGRLTDRAIERIARRCPQLRSLSVTSRQVTDQSVPALLGLTKLERLNVYQTGIGPRGLSALRRGFGGKCQVFSDVAEAAPETGK